MSQVNVTRSGAPWAVIVFLVLLILKANPGGYLDSPVENWSWWIITLPLWFGLAIVLGVLAVAGFIAGIGLLYEDITARHRRRKRK